MVRAIIKEEEVKVPEGVTVQVAKKVVTVKGKLGEISRSFVKVPIQIYEVKEDGVVKSVKIRIWFTKVKERACVRTIAKHILNMMNGVSQGYKYILKYSYERLPFKPKSSKDGSEVEIENYYGNKHVYKVKSLPGVKITALPDDPNREILLEGIDVEAIGKVMSVICQKCRSRGFDKRKFADGIYLFETKLGA